MDDVPLSVEDLEEVSDEFRVRTHMEYQDSYIDDDTVLFREGKTEIELQGHLATRHMRFELLWRCNCGPDNRWRIERRLDMSYPAYDPQEALRIVLTLEALLPPHLLYSLPMLEDQTGEEVYA